MAVLQVGYLAQKGYHFMITVAQSETYEFKKENISTFKVVASDGSWIIYKIAIKDGKSGIITGEVATQSQKGTVSMAPIERFFGNLNNQKGFNIIMKQGYICTWEAKPGPNEKRVSYKTYTEARKGIFKIISDNIDIDDCIGEIRTGYNPTFRNAVADFLYNFCHNSDSIKSADVIPSGDPNDYIDDDVEYVFNYCEADDEDDDEYYEKYNFKFEAYETGFTFRYLRGNEINMEALFLSDSYDKDSYFYEDEVFSLEYPDSKKVKDMTINLHTDIIWGTSAYPVMVLKVLKDSDKPLTQSDIIKAVCDKYRVSIERKAVGRHLDMLNALGYKIKKSKDGFLIEN